MKGPATGTKPEPFRLDHSALGGFSSAAFEAPIVGPEALAVQRAGGAVPGAPEPEPLRPIDPVGPAPSNLTPGSKLE